MSPLAWTLWLLAAYLVVGTVVGACFVTRGIQSVDAAARDASRRVRLLLLPGAAALWPIVLSRWFAAIRRAGPAPARFARGMRTLRLAHALAWTLAALVIAAGLAGALRQRAHARSSAPIAEAAP